MKTKNELLQKLNEVLVRGAKKNYTQALVG
jgi:hypothetical protein